MHRLPALALFASALLAVAPPSHAQSDLQARVAARLAEAGPGIRFGMVVADADGREIIAIQPDQRFQPASTIKLLTTAAAFAGLAMTEPDEAAGATVRMAGEDVVLEGHGDARLSSAEDCLVDCLATLADAVAARTRRVGDVIGDDSAFEDVRWSPGMGWNNIGTRSGAAVSALTLDDNAAVIRVFASAGGLPERVEAPPFLTVERHLSPGPAETARLSVERMPFDNVLYVSGTLGAGEAVAVRTVGVDDPALFAAWRFKLLLEARGVAVGGRARARHRAPGTPWAPLPGGAVLARLAPPPLLQDVRHMNKASDNLHAELLLRRIGNGSLAEGVRRVGALLDQAGVPAWSRDIADGSGMSSYDRITPRAMVAMLRWAAAQPWGMAWRETLPIGGVDGTLARRFREPPLYGRVFAKTGTLAGTSALAGYVQTRKGATLSFAIYANDVPAGGSAVPAMDAALGLVAALD